MANEEGTEVQQEAATEDTQSTAEEMVARSEVDKLYARAKKAEEEVKKYKDGQSKPTQPQDFDIEDIVHLRTDGYSREEVESIKAFARGTGKSLHDAMKDPFVANGIAGLRANRTSEEATPAPSTRTYVPQSVSKSFADAKTDDERRVLFEQRKRRGN